MSRMMTRTQRTAALALAAASIGVATLYVRDTRADAQALTPRPDELRFEAMLNEPIAAPNGRGVVAGTSALMVRDRTTGQCFLAVTVGNAMGLSPAGCQR